MIYDTTCTSLPAVHLYLTYNLRCVISSLRIRFTASLRSNFAHSSLRSNTLSAPSARALFARALCACVRTSGSLHRFEERVKSRCQTETKEKISTSLSTSPCISLFASLVPSARKITLKGVRLLTRCACAARWLQS